MDDETAHDDTDTDTDTDTGDGAGRDTFDGWALVELMGHRRLAGRVTEEVRFGAAMLRIDVPDPAGGSTTQFYGPTAIYCVTPITEETARRFAGRFQPEPIQAWELEPPPQPPQSALPGLGYAHSPEDVGMSDDQCDAHHL